MMNAVDRGNDGNMSVLTIFTESSNYKPSRNSMVHKPTVTFENTEDGTGT